MYRKFLTKIISIIILAVFLSETVLWSAPHPHKPAAYSNISHNLQVWSNFSDPSNAANLFIVGKIVELTRLQPQNDLSSLVGLLPVIPQNSNMRIVLDFRTDRAGIYGKYYDKEGALIIPFVVYSKDDIEHRIPLSSYEVKVSADGGDISIRDPAKRERTETSERPPMLRDEALKRLSRHEPHLSMDDDYGKALRGIACPDFITEETIKIREDIAVSGEKITAYFRQNLSNDDIETAIVVQTGSVLKGYARQWSDTDYPVVLIFNSGGVFPEGEKNRILEEARGIYEGKIMFAEEIRTDGMYTIPFYPVMYSSSGDALEEFRRDIINRILSKGPGESEKSWDAVRNYCQAYTDFDFLKDMNDQVSAIRRKPRLLKALKDRRVDAADYGELIRFISSRREVTRLPDLNTMAEIYDAGLNPPRASLYQDPVIDPRAIRALVGEERIDPSALYSSGYLGDKIIVHRKNVLGREEGQVVLSVREMSELTEDEAMDIADSLERWLKGEVPEDAHIQDIEDLKERLRKGLYGEDTEPGDWSAPRIYFALSGREVNGRSGNEVEALFEIKERSDNAWGTWLQTAPANRKGQDIRFTGASRQLLIYAVNHEITARGMDGIAFDLAAEQLEKDGIPLYTFIHSLDMLEKIKTRALRTHEILCNAARSGDKGAMDILMKTGVKFPDDLILHAGEWQEKTDSLWGRPGRPFTRKDAADLGMAMEESVPLKKTATDDGIIRINAMRAALYGASGKMERHWTNYRELDGKKALVADQGHMVIVRSDRSDVDSVISSGHECCTACSIKGVDVFGNEWFGHLHISASPSEYIGGGNDLPVKQAARALEYLSEKRFKRIRLQFDVPADYVDAPEIYFSAEALGRYCPGLEIEILPHITRKEFDSPGGGGSDVMVRRSVIFYRHYGTVSDFSVKSWEIMEGELLDTSYAMATLPSGRSVEGSKGISGEAHAPALTPGALVNDIAGRIGLPEELARTLQETFKAYMFSGRKLVIALDKELYGSRVEPASLERAIERWKQDMLKLQDDPARREMMRRRLENIIILSFKTPEDLMLGLSKAGIRPEEERDAHIFAFSRASAETFNNASLDRFGIKPVTINEMSRFSEWHYYPIAEIISLALAKELLGFDLRDFLSELKKSGVMLDALGISDVQGGDHGRVLIFSILPVVERYSLNDHDDRFALLLRFLQSA
ncbi:MAG: hypothetical protein WCV56_08575 [Candidatus Omnitrophota bacterium]